MLILVQLRRLTLWRGIDEPTPQPRQRRQLPQVLRYLLPGRFAAVSPTSGETAASAEADPARLDQASFDASCWQSTRRTHRDLMRLV